MQKFIQYIKFYFEPKHRDLSSAAMQSAREYYARKGKRFTSDEFQAYQRGYINAFRHSYAKAKLEGF